MNFFCLPRSLPLVAQIERLEFLRIQSNLDWVLYGAALAAILVFVVWMYFRDAVELPGWLGGLLMLLRIAAFAGLFILFLQPQWRNEREIVHNSRVLMLIDASGSMGLKDAEPGKASSAPTRLQQIAEVLGRDQFLAKLRETHDVDVYQFHDSLLRDRVVALGKLPATGEGENGAEASQNQDGETPAADLPNWRELLTPGGTETHLGDALSQLVVDEQNQPISGIILISDGRQNGEGISPDAAAAKAREANIPVYVVGMGSDRARSNVSVYDLTAPKRVRPGDPFTVTGSLQAHGMEGQTVTVTLASRESSGGANATPKELGSQEVKLGPDGEVFPVQFQLNRKEEDKSGDRKLDLGRHTLRLQVLAPKLDSDPNDNVRETEVDIVDRKNRVLLLAGGPTRDYQYVRTLLYRDRSTTLDLLLQTAQQGVSQEGNKILDEFPTERQELYEYDCIVAFDPDWRRLGPWQKVTSADGNPRLERRETTQAQIDLLENWVGDGGGMVTVAGPVFLGQTSESWVQDSRMAKVRNLYPVELQRQAAFRETNFFTAKDPSALKFTPEGTDKDYLWLGDSPSASAQAWEKLAGVYSVCQVRGPKSTATVLASFSDPAAVQAGKMPVYFAEHRYGAGWVFYLGSGELWRLRALDPNHFDQLYIKLIRHVSQERMQQGSTRGRLVVVRGDKYTVGSTVDVRVEKLTNARLELLNAKTSPDAKTEKNVKLQVVPQQGPGARTVLLEGDPQQDGLYTGRFPVLQPGKYRLELLIPDSRDERLSRLIEVRVPRFETENSQRYDAQLGRIAKDTGGKYYVGAEAAMDPKPVAKTAEKPAASRTAAASKTAVPSETTAASAEPEEEKPLVELLEDKTRTEKVREDLPEEVERYRLMWMMIGVCGVLCLEWLVRRLVKLA